MSLPMSSSRLLTKGVALVTSAARGNGRAIALRLASEGYKVVVHDLPHNGDRLIDVYRNIQRLGQPSCVMLGDISSEDEVRKLVEDTYYCFGSLDVMIANAKVWTEAPITSTSATEIWDRIFDVNARGVYLCYKYAAQQMMSQGKGGRIIGSCSTLSEQGTPLLSAYAASQAAVRSLTQSAAAEFRKYGITVNAYAPKEKSDTEDSDDIEVELEEPKLEPAAHQETPQAAAHLVSYLVSEKAQEITGQIISV